MGFSYRTPFVWNNSLDFLMNQYERKNSLGISILQNSFAYPMIQRGLKRKNMHLEDYSCVMCTGNLEETCFHILFECPFSTAC